MDMLWFALWVFLPAGLANASPVVAARLPYLRQWQTPLDGGRHYKDKRIFGDNKTWRGLLFGTTVGALTGCLLYVFYPTSAEVLRTTPLAPSVAMTLLGGLLGLGALLGDAAESFFKRQKKVPAGQSWFPFDQLDYIIGGLAFGSLLANFTLELCLIITIVWFAIHVITVYIFFLLGIRQEPI